MSTIDATSLATTASSGQLSSDKSGLKGTSDEFLKLFMAQLEHQDPMNPASGSDMVAQLAQMTAVEQSRQTNQQLADLAAAQSSSASASLTNLIGHNVNSATGVFQIDGKGNGVPPIEVSSSKPLNGASIIISDSSGHELRRIPVTAGTLNATVQWDGKDASGKDVGPGTYEISVDAGASAGTITSQWHGRVDAVELTADGPRLRIGGVLVAPATIATIGGLAALATPNLSQGETP
jgi:flagellar basal-body rod modification protein FlgD